MQYIQNTLQTLSLSAVLFRRPLLPVRLQPHALWSVFSATHWAGSLVLPTCQQHVVTRYAYTLLASCASTTYAALLTTMSSTNLKRSMLRSTSRPITWRGCWFSKRTCTLQAGVTWCSWIRRLALGALPLSNNGLTMDYIIQTVNAAGLCPAWRPMQWFV